MSRPQIQTRLDAIYRIRDACMHRIIGEASLQLLNLETRLRYQAEGLGSYIILKFDGRRRLEEIISETQKEFSHLNIGSEVINDFVGDLVENGILEKKRSPSSSNIKLKSLKAQKANWDISQLRLKTGFAYQSAAASAGCCTGS